VRERARELLPELLYSARTVSGQRAAVATLALEGWLDDDAFLSACVLPSKGDPPGWMVDWRRVRDFVRAELVERTAAPAAEAGLREALDLAGVGP
jgi:hypothetical protein